MRFTLGHESAAGWHVFDGHSMRTFYVNMKTREEAEAYVKARNVIERERQERDQKEAELAANLRRDFGGGKRFAA